MSPPGMEIARHVDLGATDAREITDQIKSSMGDLMILVAKAHQGRAWIALGYESWPDYIKGEFDHAPLALPRDERKAVVALLRGQGMSTRAIAPALGVHHDTVANDLSGVGNPTGDAAELCHGVTQLPPVPITGLDGKTYQPKPPVPQREGTKPRRGHLADDAVSIGLDLARITKRLNKMLDDDRFSRNRELIGCRIRPYPQDCLEALQRLVSEIDGTNPD